MGDRGGNNSPTGTTKIKIPAILAGIFILVVPTEQHKYFALLSVFQVLACFIWIINRHLVAH